MTAGAEHRSGRSVRSFWRDTEVSGSGSVFAKDLESQWSYVRPMGGYLAAIALRAIGRSASLLHPASFSCQFLQAAEVGPVTIETERIKVGRRAEHLGARVLQAGRPVLNASAWFVSSELPGLQHEEQRAPEVRHWRDATSVRELAHPWDPFESWAPFWHNLDVRPLQWSEGPLPSQWLAWARFLEEDKAPDAVAEGARCVFLMDLLLGMAALMRHPWPRPFLAVNLDLHVQLNVGIESRGWTLCDGRSPLAVAGLLSTRGNLWCSSGAFLSSGTARLLSVTNPEHAEEVRKKERIVEAIRAG